MFLAEPQRTLRVNENEIGGIVAGTAVLDHRNLGQGLLESVYSGSHSSHISIQLPRIHVSRKVAKIAKGEWKQISRSHVSRIFRPNFLESMYLAEA